jgi:hypothetical protein
MKRWMNKTVSYLIYLFITYQILNLMLSLVIGTLSLACSDSDIYNVLQNSDKFDGNDSDLMLNTPKSLIQIITL